MRDEENLTAVDKNFINYKLWIAIHCDFDTLRVKLIFLSVKFNF